MKNGLPSEQLLDDVCFELAQCANHRLLNSSLRCIVKNSLALAHSFYVSDRNHKVFRWLQIFKKNSVPQHFRNVSQYLNIARKLFMKTSRVVGLFTAKRASSAQILSELRRRPRGCRSCTENLSIQTWSGPFLPFLKNTQKRISTCTSFFSSLSFLVIPGGKILRQPWVNLNAVVQKLNRSKMYFADGEKTKPRVDRP